jgi:hypothetical protein
MKLTSKERFDRILKHEPVDRVGLFEVFWRETVQDWTAQGHLARPEMVSDHFGLDVRRTGGEDHARGPCAIDLIADVDAGDQVVEKPQSGGARWRRRVAARWIKTGSGAPERVSLAYKPPRLEGAHRPYAR